jgi:ankyrin repeat protein
MVDQKSTPVPMSTHTEILSQVFEAAEEGNLEALEFWISQQDFNVNESDDEGYTTLMIAVNSGHLSIVEFLLENGADVNMADSTGWTALDYAKLELDNGKKLPVPAIIDILEKAGAEPGASALYPI